jgi:hypothetical protein
MCLGAVTALKGKHCCYSIEFERNSRSAVGFVPMYWMDR